MRTAKENANFNGTTRHRAASNESETSEVHRNRDVEDRRESNRPVRPGSGGPQGGRLPRGGTR